MKTKNITLVILVILGIIIAAYGVFGHLDSTVWIKEPGCITLSGSCVGAKLAGDDKNLYIPYDTDRLDPIRNEIIIFGTFLFIISSFLLLRMKRKNTQ
jgi:hypothetical protein